MDIYKIILICHIVAGTLALISGVTAAMSKKKRGLHTLAGNSFFYSMTFSSVSALLLCVIKFNPFLLGIGLFTLYMIIGGKMVMYKKGRLTPILWKRYTQFGILTTMMMLTPALYFMYVEKWMLSILLFVFGAIQFIFTREDIKNDPTSDPGIRIKKHINKMGGGLIATVSAFVVVNVDFLPTLVVWLGPTVIGSFLISRAHRRWSTTVSRASLYLLLFVSTTLPLQAQVYVDKKTSHRFAQLTMGLETHFIPSGGRSLEQIQDFPHQLIPKVHIGGTHFWGHSEFYVTFPLGNFNESDLTQDANYYYSPGVETGMRIYPWRIEKNKLRPYAGIAMAFYSFKWRNNGNEGVLQSGFYGPLQSGITYQRGQHLFNLGVQYGGPSDELYYVSREEADQYSIQNWSFSLGWKWQLETTLSAEYLEDKGLDKFIAEKFRDKGVMSGFSLAIGPSSSFVLGNGSFNDDKPYLDQHIGMGIFPELGIGYYYAPWDAHLNLSYRKNTSTNAAFGFEQSIERSSGTLEAYKFLLDYHGFVPFVGLTLSLDRMYIHEFDKLDNYEWHEDAYRVHPGLIFGWDIRPNNVQTWILRTNLRYTPIRWELSDGRGLTFDQFEFNFIQMVWYPGRWFALRNLSFML